MNATANAIDHIGRRVKLRDLRILLALTQAGSMGRAATALAVSQPVISKAIAELEAAVGSRLFDRTPQGIVPTASGAAMIACSRAVFDELQQGVKAIKFLEDPTSGHLHVGCTEFGAGGLTPVIIEDLVGRHPGLNFHVTSADPATLAGVHLPRRTIELAMGGMPDDLPADISVERLFDDTHVVMASAGSAWTRRRKLRLADLVDGPWVLPPADTSGRRRIDAAFAARGLAPPIAKVATFSMPLCHRLLANGRYLAILPLQATSLASQMAIRPLKVDLPEIRRSIGIMTLKNRTLSPIARLFIGAARRAVAAISDPRR
jgi:DNA-binding transcriptional LysR family regulator